MPEVAATVLPEYTVGSTRRDSLPSIQTSVVEKKHSGRSHPIPSPAESPALSTRTYSHPCELLAAHIARERLHLARERLHPQGLISGADARMRPEHHVTSRPRLSSGHSLGQQQSHMEHLEAATSFRDYKQATLFPSLYLLEQQKELLRQQLLAKQLVPAQLSTPTYINQGNSHFIDGILLSQQVRDPAGRGGDTFLLPRTRLDQPLPSLDDLSHSERVRILALTKLRSPSFHYPTSPSLKASHSLSQHSSGLNPYHVLSDRGGMRDYSHSFASAPSALEANLWSRNAVESLSQLVHLPSRCGRGFAYLPTAQSATTTVNSTTSSKSTNTLTKFARRKINMASSVATLAERLPQPMLCGSTHRVPHFLERNIVPLATEEDQNWLSELNCFVRSDILELFRATEEDIRPRNIRCGIRIGQIGLRCRYCAHLPKGARAGRSACFPSSLDRIYQSFTMMLRDHFAKCTDMPQHIQAKFLLLKRKTTQGATNSRFFWVQSAERIGLVNSETGGIWIREEDQPSSSGINNIANCKPASEDDGEDPVTHRKIGDCEVTAASAQSQPSGSSTEMSSSYDIDDDSDYGGDGIGGGKNILSADEPVVSTLSQSVPAQRRRESRDRLGRQILFPQDKQVVGQLLFTVLSNVLLVHLQENERTGNRKSLPLGLPGLACRHCDQSGRKGRCRVFPTRRRHLPSKIQILCDHLVKCNLCPPSTKQELRRLQEMEDAPLLTSSREQRAFLMDLWVRMCNEIGAA